MRSCPGRPRKTACRPAPSIDAYLTGVVRDTRIPGIVALVVDADRIVYTGAFGRQNVAAGVPMATDTIFRIASMTKPVTSVAVMMLVQEGDIGLDDPVSDYLPAFEGEQVIENFNAADKTYTTRPASGPITVRHLLTHTSGLGYAFSNETLAALVGPEPGRQRHALSAAARSRHALDLRREHARARDARRGSLGPRRSKSSWPSASSCRSA